MVCFISLHWSGDNATVSYVAVPTDAVDSTVHDYDEIPNDNAEVARKKAHADVCALTMSPASSDTNYYSGTSHLRQTTFQLPNIVRKEHHDN